MIILRRAPSMVTSLRRVKRLGATTCSPHLALGRPPGTISAREGTTMDTAPFGRTGHDSSRVIFGAAALWAMPQDKADQLLEVLLQHGINHIDTAASYGDSELRVGPW